MSALLSPVVIDTREENCSGFPIAAKVSKGLIQDAATPPIMEVFRKLRLVKVVIIISIWHKQTYKNNIGLRRIQLSIYQVWKKIIFQDSTVVKQKENQGTVTEELRLFLPVKVCALEYLVG